MIPVSAEQLFETLADGWLYSGWVVGASHIRAVDSDWPQVGARIHHSVGPWPFTVADTTEVTAVDPPYLLELNARLWPVGAARIRMELNEFEQDLTRVRMLEHAVRGPAALAPEAAQEFLLAPRNRESLARLADLAVGRDQRKITGQQ
ncbi:SRPBCC family protein [Nocardia sp. NPDC005366]|uniref:SRPBCC family protein n=1 Tax=Nocardia sp. NPDC005366 TaxID=3156878 RepID=UPI0033A31824